MRTESEALGVETKVNGMSRFRQCGIAEKLLPFEGHDAPGFVPYSARTWGGGKQPGGPDRPDMMNAAQDVLFVCLAGVHWEKRLVKAFVAAIRSARGRKISTTSESGRFLNR